MRTLEPTWRFPPARTFAPDCNLAPPHKKPNSATMYEAVRLASRYDVGSLAVTVRLTCLDCLDAPTGRHFSRPVVEMRSIVPPP